MATSTVPIHPVVPAPILFDNREHDETYDYECQHLAMRLVSVTSKHDA
jgi:hypothetical protein